MPKYEIRFHYFEDIEAENEEEAVKKFYDNSVYKQNETEATFLSSIMEVNIYPIK